VSILTDILVDGPVGEVIKREAARKRSREEILQKYAQKKAELELQLGTKAQYTQPPKSIADKAMEEATEKALRIEAEKKLGIYKEPAAKDPKETPEQEGISAAKRRAAQIEEERRLGIYEEKETKPKSESYSARKIRELQAELAGISAIASEDENILKEMDTTLPYIGRIMDYPSSKEYAETIIDIQTPKTVTLVDNTLWFDKDISYYYDTSANDIMVKDGDEITNISKYENRDKIISAPGFKEFQKKLIEFSTNKKKAEILKKEYDKNKSLIEATRRKKIELENQLKSYQNPDLTSYEIETTPFQERLKKLYS